MCLMPRASQKDWPPSYNMAASYKKTASSYKKTLIPYETGHLGTTNAQYQHVFVSKCTCCVRHTSSESVKIIGRDTVAAVYDRCSSDWQALGVMNCRYRRQENAMKARLEFVFLSSVFLFSALPIFDLQAQHPSP